MALSVSADLGGEFRRRAEILRQQRLMHDQREQRERKAKADAENEEVSEFLDAAVMMATSDDIIEFEAELYLYDAATIEALQENDIALDAVREHLANLLDQAHVHHDGRRVFKTIDGTQVFDEHGSQLSPLEIDPDEIADDRPRWETYKTTFDEEQALMEERRELLEFQNKLDAARDRIDGAGITTNELDDLRDELETMAPASVRSRVPASDPEAHSRAALKAEPRMAETLDIDDEMVPGTIKPATLGLSN